MKEDRDKDERRARRARQRSDKALYVALHVLLNLGEDSGVEHKMVRRRLVHHLASILTHATSAPLLVLTAVFLTRLARYAENKDTMVRFESKFMSLGSLVVYLRRALFTGEAQDAGIGTSSCLCCGCRRT